MQKGITSLQMVYILIGVIVVGTVTAAYYFGVQKTKNNPTSSPTATAFISPTETPIPSPTPTPKVTLKPIIKLITSPTPKSTVAPIHFNY